MTYASTSDPTEEPGDTADPQLLLDALRDEDSRRLVVETTEEARTAKELAEATDLSLSATYRRLERLTEAGLVAEGTRAQPGRRPAAEYRRNFDGVIVSIDDNGQLEVTPRHTMTARSD